MGEFDDRRLFLHFGTEEELCKQAFLHLAMAREAYNAHGLPGSVEKDVVAEDSFKAAGAEIDSYSGTLDLGLCLVGAPLQKRLGLAVVSLRTVALSGISRGLAAKLSGSWESCLMFRRCMSATVDGLFAIGAGKSSEDSEEVVDLPRRVAQELAFLSVLAVIMASDVSAPVLDNIFSTDASLSRGAIVAKKVGTETSGDKKGGYTMLDLPFRAWRREYDADFDEEEGLQMVSENFGLPSPEKPPAFSFGFLEVCGCAGVVGEEMSRLGFVVGPNLDISFSVAYDIRNLRLIEWVLFVLSSGRLDSIMLEPVCTKFSPAAHPACRSYKIPEGFDQSFKKVQLGNLIAYRCLFLLWFAWTGCYVGESEAEQDGLASSVEMAGADRMH